MLISLMMVAVKKSDQSISIFDVLLFTTDFIIVFLSLEMLYHAVIIENLYGGSTSRAIIWREYDSSVDDRVLTFNILRLILTLVISSLFTYFLGKQDPITKNRVLSILLRFVLGLFAVLFWIIVHYPIPD